MEMIVAPSWSRDEYLVSCDPAATSLEVVHRFLCEESYWARDISRNVVATEIANSLCFSLLHRDTQIGFARVITDRATIAYLGDVFVLEAHRGKGLARWLMQCVMSHPELQGLRRWILLTSDAHRLYEKFGFAPVLAPEKWMEKFNPQAYAGTKPA
ncbi:MAG TPA: GNAT family N-acetyltransferase [Usitatibacteraceae bacterium]